MFREIGAAPLAPSRRAGTGRTRLGAAQETCAGGAQGANGGRERGANGATRPSGRPADGGRATYAAPVPLPPTTLTLSAAALSLLLAGCGGGQPNVDSAATDELAQRADRVAEALEAGDGCLALERTAELQSATATARDEGRVTDTVAAEVLTAAQRIAQGTSCEPPPEEEDDGHDGEEDRDDGNEGNGRGRGKGRGNDDD